MPAATLVGLYRNHTLFQKLAVPWAACALVKDCIAPVGASKDKGASIHDPGSWYTIADYAALMVLLSFLVNVSGNHFQDQSALSMLALGRDPHMYRHTREFKLPPAAVFHSFG